ncbi:MAG: Ig-like domain-containing protein [Steroidobacteraceae bacterium]
MGFGQAMQLTVVLVVAAAAGCTGNGEGLDQNGQPLGPSGSTGEPLTADFTSIQDNVFTPICTRCHIGASAPEGLQLDATHSYGLLVGVPSAEQPNTLRVNPGNPDASYLVLKLEGASGISGGRMPLGGPYLPQSTIDVIRQWITEGAQPPQGVAHTQTRTSFDVVATSPADTATVAAPVREIVVAFSSEVDAALVNGTTLKVEPVTGSEFLTTTSAPIQSAFQIAPGNPATVVIHPVSPLGPGKYRVTVRGTGDSGALASVFGVALGADYDFVFTVESVP